MTKNSEDVVSFEIIQKDIGRNATLFSEGCEKLEHLLKTLWEHGIETNGCCAGHLEPGRRYVKDRFLLPAVEISEKEYQEHMGKKNYHMFLYYHKPYIAIHMAIRPSERKLIIESFEKQMADIGIEAYVTHSSESIDFHSRKVLDKEKTGQFFESIEQLMKGVIV